MQSEPVDYSEGPDPDLVEPGLPEATAAVVSIPAAGGAGERIDRFVASMMREHSRTRIQRWLGLGAITVDGQPVLPKYRLRGHESIEVTPLPGEAEQSFEPDEVALQVVHEDADLMVVDKPAGLVTHPGPGNWRGTLMNGLLHGWPDSAHLPRAGIVHRLDKDTSGLLMVARSERGFERLGAMIAARSVQRRYIALVHGEAATSTIDAPIGRDPRDRLRMAVVPAGRGKPAVTHVLRVAGASDGGCPLSLLECRLETGRTHQIRVHLASRGHPLVGDATYGGRACHGFERQALHAWRLLLQHPCTGRPLDLRSPPPEDLDRLLGSLGLREAVSALLAGGEPTLSRQVRSREGADGAAR
jgi:23S rRNA pseudouridine1911/1915/1917 synthase